MRIPRSEQPEFHRHQAEIYQDLAQELVALTPEHWESAVLEISATEEGVRQSIWSDEGHKDVVTPSTDLFGYTRLLELLFIRYDCMFKTARFRVFLGPDGDWSFEVDYDY